MELSSGSAPQSKDIVHVPVPINDATEERGAELKTKFSNCFGNISEINEPKGGANRDFDRNQEFLDKILEHTIIREKV